MAYEAAALFHVTGPRILPPPPGSVKSGQYLKGFKELVRHRGGDWMRIVEANHINAAVVEDPERSIDWTSAISLLDYCSRTLGDDLFGLHLADAQGADVYGCVSTLARAAPTLRQGFQSIADFLPFLHSPGAEVELVTGTHISELRWFPRADFATFEQANHHGLMLAVRLLAAVGGKAYRPSYAVSVSNSPHNRDMIEHLLGCPVRWQANNDAIGFPTELLDQPLDSSNPTLFGLLASYMLQLKEANGPSIIDQVETYVAGSFRSGNCSIGGCAARLGLSSRTLQKRLMALGVSFSGVVEEQRIEAAKTMLRGTPRTLDEISDYLGYSEKSSFSRAFKKSTRLTPLAFRSQQRA